MMSVEPPAIDASPLIILAQGGLLHLVQIAGSDIIVPEAVAVEVRRHGDADPAAHALRELPWLHVVPTGPVEARVRAFGLGPGESAVLMWTLAHPGAEAIIDDRAGRRAATALNIPLRGTLGLILAAKQQGLIPAARPVIEHLVQTTNWYVSEHEREHALRRVSE